MTASGDERPTLYHVVMLAFDGADTANRVVERLKGEHAFEGCEIEGAAVISRDATGHIHAHERGSAGIGAAFGTAAATIIGVVTGPVLLPIMLAVGAVGGGLAGHFAGQVLPSEDLRKVAESLAPDTSAYIAVVDTRHARNVIDAFGSEGRLVVDSPIETEIANAVREGVLHNVRRA
jgi:uncharacterized membrane protein